VPDSRGILFCLSSNVPACCGILFCNGPARRGMDAAMCPIVAGYYSAMGPRAAEWMQQCAR